MKRLSLLLTTMMVMMAGLLITSCQPKEEAPEEPTLTLSQTALTFANKAEVPTAPQVTVTTNQSKWTVSAPSEWITATAQGNGIVIAVSANEGGKDRKGEVLVFAGGLVEKVTVTQSAADIVLDVNPSERVVPQKGEVFLIDVRSNTQAWQVEEAEQLDWMEVSKFQNFIQVNVAPNDTKDARIGKLYAKVGTITKEIAVKQAGKGDMRFKLPMLSLFYNEQALIKYEIEQNGNYLRNYAAAIPNWGLYTAEYYFVYSSEVFQLAEYSVNVAKDNILESITLKAAGGHEALASDEFKEFLRGNGFEMQEEGTTKNNFFANLTIQNPVTKKKEYFQAQVQIGDDTKASEVKIIPVFKQEQPYPTFSEFPYERSSWLSNPEWPYDKIKAEESKLNPVKMEEAPNEKFPGFVASLLVEVNASLAPLHTRLFFMNPGDKEAKPKVEPTNLLDEELAVWSEPTLGVFEAYGMFFLTDEFKALLKKEGFVFFREVRGKAFYYNRAKKLMVVPRGARYGDIRPGKVSFTMNYFLFEEDASRAEQDRVLKVMSERVEAVDKALGKM